MDCCGHHTSTCNTLTHYTHFEMLGLPNHHHVTSYALIFEEKEEKIHRYSVYSVTILALLAACVCVCVCEREILFRETDSRVLRVTVLLCDNITCGLEQAICVVKGILFRGQNNVYKNSHRLDIHISFAKTI